MIVYKATNKFNSKIYIGQTINSLSRRISKHKRYTTNGSSTHFHNAIRKYGIDSFKWEVIRICDNINELNAFEQYYILYYDSMENGYNLTSGGLNYRMSDVTKEKMRQINLGRKHSEKTKKLVSKNSPKIWLGKKLTKETRKKMSEAKQNMSDETRKKMSEAHKSKTMSIKTRKKMSNSHKGEKNHFYGEHHTKEAKAKMVVAHKNITDETREKMRESRLKYLANQKTGE